MKSLSARMERWELEGKPIYINPQNTDSRGFRKPNNNVPQDFLREQKSRDRDDQRIQTPLQNNLVSHEEGEGVDELDLEIHCIEDTSPFPHLTQSTYEESLINTQINELSRGEKASNTPNRYNLRSRKKEGNFDSQAQPLIAERPTKAVATTTKEKKAQDASPAAKEPGTEVREVPKPIPSFNF
jgi:hypothetical protein